MPPPKRISQVTFDDTIEENMREFGMERAEAAADAVTYFTAAGVDLAGLITDGSDAGAQPVVAALRVIRAWGMDVAEPGAAPAPDAAALGAAFADVVATCGAAGEAGTRARTLARS
jgi:methylmalonyl-CoA mutase cobalamin-binding subunit